MGSVFRAVDLPPPVHDPEQVRRAVADVLARPEFAERAPGLAQRLLDALAELFAAVVEALVGTGQAPAIGTVILLVALVAAALLALWFARGIARDRTPPAEVDTQEPARDAAAWHAEADAYERDGRWRDAVRCRWRAAVAALQQAGVTDEVAGRTAGEYLAEVRDRLPAVAGPFTAATRRFEAAWYGGRTVDADDAAGARADVEAVRRAVRAGAR